MQHKANRGASQQKVGWIEEVNKGLAGLRLYAEMSRLLREAPKPTDSRLIEDTVRLIEQELGSP